MTNTMKQDMGTIVLAFLAELVRQNKEDLLRLP